MRPRFRFAAALTLAWISAAAVAQAAEPAATLVVSAGSHERRDSLIQAEAPLEKLPSHLRQAIERGPTSVMLRDQGEMVAAEADRGSSGSARLTFFLPGTLAANGERKLTIDDSSAMAPADSSWSLTRTEAGALDLKRGDRMVFRYNIAKVAPPGSNPVQHRNAYIHPALSPKGSVITGDYSAAHTHHRGFFFAYAAAQSGKEKLDFWNLHRDSARIECESVDHVQTGPVVARFSAHHAWKNKGGQVVLKERWEIAAYDVPGSPYWLWDLTSVQQAVGQPLELLPYRYGGMAYRGPDPFLKGPIDVLTNEKANRKDADQKPARWMDLTGPIVDGSTEFAGAMICDHPSNVNHPNTSRVHPTTLPFFAFTPAHYNNNEKPKIAIPVDRPLTLRYRVLIHDGHPDKARDEQVWRDFADPPQVKIE